MVITCFTELLLIWLASQCIGLLFFYYIYMIKAPHIPWTMSKCHTGGAALCFTGRCASHAPLCSLCWRDGCAIKIKIKNEPAYQVIHPSLKGESTLIYFLLPLKHWPHMDKHTATVSYRLHVYDPIYNTNWQTQSTGSITSFIPPVNTLRTYVIWDSSFGHKVVLMPSSYLQTLTPLQRRSHLFFNSN